MGSGEQAASALKDSDKPYESEECGACPAERGVGRKRQIVCITQRIREARKPVTPQKRRSKKRADAEGNYINLLTINLKRKLGKGQWWSVPLVLAKSKCCSWSIYTAKHISFSCNLGKYAKASSQAERDHIFRLCPGIEDPHPAKGDCGPPPLLRGTVSPVFWLLSSAIREPHIYP